MNTRNTFRIGTVIHGTHRPYDLIPAFLETLRRLPDGDAAVTRVIDRCSGSEGPSFASFMVVGDTWGRSEDDAELAAYLASVDCSYDVDALIEELQYMGAPYTRFGTHEGDASDYGYWPDMDAIQADAVPLGRYDAARGADLIAIEDPSDLERLPADFYGAAVLVNDHGNVSMYSVSRYSASDPGRVFKLLWDCV